MSTGEPRIGPFDPAATMPSTNGHPHKRRRRHVLRGGGILFGVLVGAIISVSLVSRVGWLNLSNPAVSPWWRPVVAAVAAGLMVGWWRRRDLVAAAAGGALAALLALWSVYALVRISTPVVFIERSMVTVITFDLLRLASYALPAGAIGAVLPVLVRVSVDRVGDRRRGRGR